MELVAGSLESIIVHLLSIGRLPRLLQLNRVAASPYVLVWLVDEQGERSCEPVSWMPRMNNREPVWNSAQDLGFALRRSDMDRTKLKVEVWDYDPLLSHNLIGSAEVALTSLVSEQHVSVPLLLSTLADPSADAPDGVSSAEALMTMLKRGVYGLDMWAEGIDPMPTPRTQPCMVQMRLTSGSPLRKRLYVIRHGESVWNKGQSEANLVAMYSQVDHPLSSEGRRQAEVLAATLEAATNGSASHGDDRVAAADADSLRTMCEAQAILCSPLTRALQTCIIGLQGALRSRPRVIRLVPNARERRNHGSVDSIGCCIGGAEIKGRLQEKTMELYADAGEAATKTLVDAAPLDDLEVRTRWWSTSVDAKNEVDERIAEFMRQVRYSADETMVLVGHSHWIRELLRVFLNESFVERLPGLAKQLQSRKLSNCGVACLDLDFNPDVAAQPIVNVTLLARTELIK